MSILEETHREKAAVAALSDSLSEVTRKERRLLLIIATMCYAVSRAGLVPTKLTALGIDFSQTNQKAIFSVLAATLSYLVVTFITYAAADFILWRIAAAEAFRVWWTANIKEIEEEATKSDSSRILKEKLGLKINTTSLFLGFATPVAFLRALIDFVFPIGFGIYCIFLMLATKP